MKNKTNYNKNLLIISPHYSTFVKGPTEELAEFFKEIHVIIPKFDKLNFFGWKISLFKTVEQEFMTQKRNVKIHEIPVSWFLPLAATQIKKYIFKKKIEFDSVFSHFLIPYGYLGNKISKDFMKKSILLAHGFDIYLLPFKNIFYKTIIQDILKNSDKVITVSNSNLKCLKKLGFADKSVVVTNGFDSDKFFNMDKESVRKTLNIDPDKKIILTVGNLVKVKNQIAIIKACNELKKIRTDFICYIIGSGELEHVIKNEISKYHLDNYVTLTGLKPHNEIPLWMNAADLFVLPSYSEGNPTVMFESLGCGLPYVGTNVGGVDEVIVSAEYGLIYDNPEDYAKLRELIDKGLNKMWDNEKIINYSEKYSWKNIKDKIIEEYIKII